MSASLIRNNKVFKPCTTHLGLQQAAFQQHKRLPLVLMNELPQAHTKILIAATFLLHDASGLFICQALLKAAQNLNIGKLALGKPGMRDHAEALTEHAKELRAVGNDDDGFLHRRPRHVGRAVDELRGIELARARDAEEGGGGLGGGCWAEEGKVGEVFFGAVMCIGGQVSLLAAREIYLVGGGGEKRTRGHRRLVP